MERQAEPDLMDEPLQARAYAEADFAEPHNAYVELLYQYTEDNGLDGTALDLGCGPADIVIRVAHRFPQLEIHAVDGAAAMLALAKEAINRECQEHPAFAQRIKLHRAYLPVTELPLSQYDVILSNSLLHHLNDPVSLWETIKRFAKKGALVFVMDLLRPDTEQQAKQLVEQYAVNEPDILRRDFYHSLLAAYTEQEISQQLHQTGLSQLAVKVIDDRHVVIAGRVG